MTKDEDRIVSAMEPIPWRGVVETGCPLPAGYDNPAMVLE
jgi:hypothetical protein